MLRKIINFCSFQDVNAPVPHATHYPILTYFLPQLTCEWGPRQHSLAELIRVLLESEISTADGSRLLVVVLDERQFIPPLQVLEYGKRNFEKFYLRERFHLHKDYTSVINTVKTYLSLAMARVSSYNKNLVIVLKTIVLPCLAEVLQDYVLIKKF